MIDHVLGRPSASFRKHQVFLVVSFWSFYLLRGNKHGPLFIRKLSTRLSRTITPWQTMIITLLWLYISRNFAKICGLESPEPLANLYNRSYFRATWVTTALDAGFWTAMRIRRKWLRDLASIVFTLYYLIAAEQADEKVRKVRATLTVDHLRVSWNKSTTPYISFLTGLLRPKLIRYQPRRIRIPRPQQSSYKEPVSAWLYYDAPFSTIKQHNKIILDIPGGGFVAMTPRNHDDKLCAWAGKTGLPILSLEYKKAPEFPYPYALNECYDVYHTLIASRGTCIGLSGEEVPRIVLTGDSAGGNLATGVVLMILQTAGYDGRRWSSDDVLPVPQGLVLMYPGLDMNIGNWMSDEQMALIQDRRTRATNKNILRRKSEDYYKLDPSTPHPSDEDLERAHSPPPALHSVSSVALISEPGTPAADRPDPSMAHLTPTTSISQQQADVALSKPRILKTRLAMSSMISYFNDRILTPEMMRAMIILYIGPHNRPDFSTDFLLSPLLAPESLLARFPKVYFLTGERDPLVDDTVIFAGRLRQAKLNVWQQRRELGLVGGREVFDERDHVEVALIPGISHGFLQFVSVFPEGWRHIFRCTRWFEELFALDARDGRGYFDPGVSAEQAIRSNTHQRARHHTRTPTTESEADEERPLMMTRLSAEGTDQGGSHGHSKTKHKHSEASRATARGRETRRGSSRPRAHRRRSLVSLASEEDLLGRRMKGLAGGLMGMTPADGGLDTP